MSQEYLVVFGGGKMVGPAITRFKEGGHKVLVVDGNSAAPSRLVADIFVHQDFSDIAATELALADYRVSGLVPLNDFAVAAASAIARSRGLPGWSHFSELCARSKVAMKKTWMAANLPTAQCCFSTVDQVLSSNPPPWNHWPCVVKPSFSGGGSRGVFVANSSAEIVEGLLELRKTYLDGDVVIEEFIEGTEHTLEVLVCHGEPFLLSISDKANYHNSPTVVQRLYFPGPIGNAHRAEMQSLVYEACRVMRMDNGTAHFEVMLRAGRPYLLEVGGRPGGGINLHPICELSTGYDYPSLLAAVLTGNPPDFLRKPNKYLAWHYFDAGPGILREVLGFDEVAVSEGVVDAALYEKIGQERMDLRDDLARPGYILVAADSHVEAKQLAHRLEAKVKFLVD
ncbi:ATP-grasp domain-containing protein [Polaromonas sp.]|uniref:ATP-grasp domain-containing protein n=1 Tax=Polaromonas sp. TaxID=1869339 RepID=UPI003BA8D5E4